MATKLPIDYRTLWRNSLDYFNTNYKGTYTKGDILELLWAREAKMLRRVLDNGHRKG